jgi:ribose transport system permease protein
LRTVLGAFSVSRISGLYVLVALIVGFSLWLPDVFLTTSTAKNILNGQTITAIVAVGLLFTIAAGAFDLSIGFNVSMVSVVFAKLLTDGMGLATAIVIALLVALAIGVLNAVVVVVIGIDSFIATLAVGSVLQALTLLISGNAQIVGVPPELEKLTASQPAGVPIGLAYLVVVGLVAWWLLEHSPFGRRIYAVGFGAEAARLAGIRADRHKAAALIITALCAGFAGILLTGIVGSASPEIGPSYLLPAFAAAFLGSTQIHPGRMNVPGTIIAVYLLATGATGLQLAGAQIWVTSLFNGVALLVAVGLTVLKVRLDVGTTRRRAKAAATQPEASGEAVQFTGRGSGDS